MRALLTQHAVRRSMQEESEITITVWKPIKCKLITNADLTTEDCKQLLNDDLKELFEVVSNPITNLGSLKLEAFKLGFEWVEENGYQVFLKDKIKVLKISILGKWIKLNPKITELEYGSRDQIFSLLEAIPDTFTIMLGNTSIKLNELRNTLNLVPF